jgi:class 3 adenylate cyclase
VALAPGYLEHEGKVVDSDAGHELRAARSGKPRGSSVLRGLRDSSYGGLSLVPRRSDTGQAVLRRVRLRAVESSASDRVHVSRSVHPTASRRTDSQLEAAVEGERKQVTVLFADLKGSMELLADRDPEETREILDPVSNL